MSDSADTIAVPGHVGRFAGRDASPGLSFGMLLDAWKWQDGSIVKDEDKLNRDKLRPVLSLDGQHEKLLAALGERQRRALKQHDERCLFVVEAEAIAPFATGLGNAHPTENGFTFSVPHGLPVLPGSGVKGVLRAAAGELAMSDPDSGWSEALIDALFGRAPAEAHANGIDARERGVRGALSFHDVFPQRTGTQRQLLEIDVMTPHQSHYLAEGQTPHDYGQPNPILFVTVAPGARFLFHVICDRSLLKASLAGTDLAEAFGGEGWKPRIESAFEHAFEWLGFGAKTSVGYGAMHADDLQLTERRERSMARDEEQRRQLETEQRRVGMDDIDLKFDQELMKAKARHPDQSELLQRLDALEHGDWSASAATRRTVGQRQREWMQDHDEWAEVSNKKNHAKDKKYQRTLAVKRVIDDV